MKVLKFGGTSVGSAARMKAVVDIINRPEPLIVVLSAMSGTTNALVQLSGMLYKQEHDKALQHIAELEHKYKQVINELYGSKDSKVKAEAFIAERFDMLRELSRHLFNEFQERWVLAEGEILSTHLFFFYLEELGIKAVLLNALDFMRVDINHEPELDYIGHNLKERMQEHPEVSMFITQGYICRNSFGEVDNLKRGGSDYSASLIGAAIHAEEIQIWTDIDGMHNNDPRFVDRTVPVAELSFDEAAELAYFGAKILHPQSVNPARQRKIPVRLLNTMAPQMKGTVISDRSAGPAIKAVAAKDGITAIKVKSGRMLLAYGFMRRVFEVFERYKTSIDMVTTSEVGVSITIDNTNHLEGISAELREFSSVEVDFEQTIVCIVGDMLSTDSDFLNKIFASLSGIPVRMVSYGGSKNNVSLLVATVYKAQVLQALNKGIFGL